MINLQVFDCGIKSTLDLSNLSAFCTAKAQVRRSATFMQLGSGIWLVELGHLDKPHQSGFYRELACHEQFFPLLQDALLEWDTCLNSPFVTGSVNIGRGRTDRPILRWRTYPAESLGPSDVVWPNGCIWKRFPAAVRRKHALLPMFLFLSFSWHTLG